MNNSGYTMTVADFINDSRINLSGWAIVDFRPKEIYAIGHLPAAMNIPLANLTDEMRTIPEGRKVAVYCCNDIDAAFGVMTLRVFADRDAWVLQGGLTAWVNAGMKMEYSQYR